MTAEEWALAASVFFSGLAAGFLGGLCTILRPMQAAMTARSSGPSWNVPPLRRQRLGQGVQLCLVGRDDHRVDRRARAPLGRSRLHLLRPHRDRPGRLGRRDPRRLQRVEDTDLQHDPGRGPRGDASGLAGDTQRYFTINWLQFATTWAAFALFLVALISR